MINECRHIFASGKKCQAFAVADSSFCYFHRNQRERNDAIVRPDTPFILPPIEDAHGALLAVNDVLRAMGQGRIKRSEAGTYFYGLQIAARLIVRIDQTSIKPVRNLSYDRHGTELAEEKTICEPPEDCLYCTKRDTCDKFEDYEEEVEELIQIAQQEAEKEEEEEEAEEAEGEEEEEGEDDQEKDQILDRLQAQAGWRVNRIPTIAPHTMRSGGREPHLSTLWRRGKRQWLGSAPSKPQPGNSIPSNHSARLGWETTIPTVSTTASLRTEIRNNP